MKGETRMKTLLILVVALLFFCHTVSAQPSSAPPADAKTKNAITGQVIGADGKPVKNAAVSATAIGTRNSQSRAVTTNEDGAFRIPDVKPGAYRLAPPCPASLLQQKGWEFLSGRIRYVAVG